MPLSTGQAHCRLCDRLFNSLSSAKSHLANVHSCRRVECQLCGHVDNSVQSFRMHIVRRHGIRGCKNVLQTYGNVLEQVPIDGGGGVEESY